MKPTVVIEDEVYKKVMHWVGKSQYEVSGLGMVRVEKDGVLRVVSAMLLPQKNGSTHTDIEAEDVNKALYLLRESEGDLRWWWHSHVKMAVFWSGTDHDTIKKIGAGGWFAATVFNQKNEVKSAYYGSQGQQTPWGVEPLFLDDLKTQITCVDDPRVAEWDAEYDKNVTLNQPVWQGGYGGNALGGSLTTGTAYMNTTEFDPSVAPPAVRPFDMKKKTYKAWNTAHVDWKLREMRGLSNHEFNLDTRQPATALGQAAGLDEYGFTQDERTLLAQEGWTMNDVDELLDQEMTPTEMVRMATLGIKPGSVTELIEDSNYTNEDISDLLDQSEAFGKDLFETSTAWRDQRKGLYE